MNIRYYQTKAFGFLVHPEGSRLDDGYCYPALGLIGEIGEVAEILKKIYRDSSGLVSDEASDRLKKELGDVLWYIALLATSVDTDLEALAFAEQAQAAADLVFSHYTHLNNG